MPNRDYAPRSKPRKGGSPLLILTIVAALLIGSGVALWLLKTKSPAPPPARVVTDIAPKSQLPSRPEEVYSYIRDLETREVPVDKNAISSLLSKEQERQILRQREEEKRRLAQPVVPSTPTTATPSVSNAEQEAEEKRKQAELRKAQEQERARAEQEKAEAAARAAAEVKTTPEVQKPSGQFGLQCGAFKNKAQAENMQARLSMAGFNARISSSAEWNRVFVGPIGDRAAAVKAQSNAKSVAECLVVSM